MLQNNKKSIYPCKGFTQISRSIINGRFPKDFLSGVELKRYLIFNYTKSASHGTTYSGYKQYKKVAGFVNKKVYANAVKYLESTNLVTKVRETKTRKYYEVNIPPYYDKKNNKILELSCIPMTKKTTQKSKHNFIRLPNELVDKKRIFDNKLFSTEELYVILKIYRYNFFTSFGGVDSQIIRKENGSILIENRTYEDIYLTKSEFIETLQQLEAEGIITWVDIVIRAETIEFETINTYVCDYSKGKTKLGKNQRIISIVRPLFQVVI